MRLSNLPAVAWVCITVVFLGILAAFTYLSSIGADATEIRTFLNTVANFGGLLLGGVAAVGAGVAARKADQAVQQTNGGLDTRIEQGAKRALTAQRTEDTDEDTGEIRRVRH